jgi:hypothetical protein
MGQWPEITSLFFFYGRSQLACEYLVGTKIFVGGHGREFDVEGGGTVAERIYQECAQGWRSCGRICGLDAPIVSAKRGSIVDSSGLLVECVSDIGIQRLQLFRNPIENPLRHRSNHAARITPVSSTATKDCGVDLVLCICKSFRGQRCRKTCARYKTTNRGSNLTSLKTNVVLEHE